MTVEVEGAADPPWHALEPREVVDAFGSDLTSGLSEHQAATRLGTVGRNELGEQHRPSALVRLLAQLDSPLIWVLIAAALISALALDEWVEAAVILAIVAANAVLGHLQEARAERALAALRLLTAPEATVRRDGRDRRLPAAEVVPGDLLLLAGGDRVPADARVVDHAHLSVDESMLTGESLPIGKSAAPVGAAARIADRRSVVHAGTMVAAGRGRAVVVATGRRTELGRLAALLGGDTNRTPLQHQLDRVGTRLAVLAIVVAATIFGIGVARGFSVESMFLTAVALAVAAIPEGLPAVITVILARGVTTMARHEAVVRRLTAVEALGSVSVICTDKTGTLTLNDIEVRWIAVTDEPAPVDRLAGDEPGLYDLAVVAVLCNDATVSTAGHLGDPTEVALLRMADQRFLDAAAVRVAHPRIGEVGFDSQRKRMSTLHRSPSGLLLCVKGAPEEIVDRCHRHSTPHGSRPFDGATRSRVMGQADALAARGLRTLALARRSLDAEPGDLGDAECDLEYLGLVGMSDGLRPEAAASVAEAHAAGIEVVMVTGDHRVTAEAIGSEAGILDDDGLVLAGDELAALDAGTLAPQVDRYAVYARVDPADKVKIVDAWQRRGHIVAMTGDGVNDAPALQAADVGVAMGSGTDAAKEASAIVLTDDDFSTIVRAVRQGRTVFDNLKAVVYFLLSANLAEVIVMLVGVALLDVGGQPLLATQLLWINLVTDGLPALAMGFDTATDDVMARRPDRHRQILSRRHQTELVILGGVLATGVLGVLAYGTWVRDLPIDDARTLAFTTLVATQLAHVFTVRGEGSAAWARRRPNKMLTFAVASSIALHLLVLYTPVGHRLFDASPVQAVDWPAIGVATALPFVVLNLRQAHRCRRGRPDPLWPGSRAQGTARKKAP